MGLRYLGNIIKPGYNPLASNITTGVNVVQYQGVFTAQQQLQAQANQQWSTDPVFDYSTLLLQADGIANGSQNNTFLDSSTNNFTITRNGNTTQGTFSPFSLQPGAWANYFNGSSQLTVPNTNGPIQFGTGAFTIEFWIYPSDVSNRQAILATTSGSGTGPVVALSGSPAGAFGVGIYGSADTLNTGAGVIVTNKWQHIAVVRNSTASNDSFIYVDGILRATGTISTNFSTAYAVSIGQNGAGGEYFTGYLSNLRVVKGTAVYTTNFTPSPTPLTAITNTSLLTCQNNRFVDNSSNAFAVTVNGTPSVQAFSPFAPQFQYTASGTGGSGYFDGTGDYLSVANNAAFNFGSGAFTVECWFYATSLPGDTVLISNYKNPDGYTLRITSNKYLAANLSGDGIDIEGATTIPTGTWNHAALSGSSGSIKLFLNGVQQGSTFTGAVSLDTTAATTIGTLFDGSAFYLLNGYVSSARIVKGGALYTAAFTPSTSPFTTTVSAGTVSLLTNFTNAGITDATAKNDLETVGNAQVSTSVVKYGSGSMYFDGTGDWLLMPSNPMFAFPGQFTVEFWLYRGATQTNFPAVFCVTSGLFVGFDTTNSTFGVAQQGVSSITPAAAYPAANTWVHIAVTRDASNLIRIFYNGVQQASGTIATSYASGITYVGKQPSYGDYNGYIDDLRVTKGIARYTQNFIPPSVALPRQ